ncbi:MAG TPA: hypothetical protein VGI90_16470 [Steroidobacteraceae bacterium]|jgi:hypothetical protein
MKRCWHVALIVLASACSHSPAHQGPASCGPIDSQIAGAVQQQLPADVAVNEGCWEIMANGRLEGRYFTLATDKRHNLDTYVFEHREGEWILTETRYELVVWHERR